MRSSIREDKDQNDESRVESLIGYDVPVDDGGFVGLSGYQIEDVGVGGNQNQNVLQEYVLVVYGQGQ